MSEEGEMGELVKSLDKKEDSEGEAHERSPPALRLRHAFHVDCTLLVAMLSGCTDTNY